MISSTKLNDILTNGITIYSSGTTGDPKPVFQSPEKLKSCNSIARGVQTIRPESKIYTVCTLDHAGGLLAQTLPALEIGAEVDYDKFNPYTWVKKIKNYTHSHLTPGMAAAAIKTKEFKNLNLRGKIIMCGSDPVSSDIIQAFVDQNCRFIVNWGMSEVGPVAINKSYTKYGRPVDLHEHYTIMGDCKMCDTKIVDGELYVRGEICVYDDWFATGDLVEKINDDYWYVGRK